MHSNDPHTSSSERRSTLKFCAALILSAGLAVAAFVYPHGTGRSGDDEPGAAEMPLSLQDSRRESRELEIQTGKLGVLVNRWMEVGKAWTQPKPLAITIALASGVAAACIYRLSTFPPRPPRA